MIILWIITSIVLFSIIVLIHELGHFTAARKFWVRVEEFGLWIPPRAKKLFKDKKWTLYSLNWLPIGWFVKLTWEMPNTFLVYNKNKELYNNENLQKDIENKKDIFDSKWNIVKQDDLKIILNKLKENKANYNLMNKPSWQQAIIILAWVFMNFLLAAFIFSILFFIWIKPLWINTKIETNLDLKLIPTYEQAIESGLLIKNPWIVINPVEWSIAEKAKIKQWDIIQSIWTCEFKMWDYWFCLDENWKETNKLWNHININSPSDLIKLLKNNKWKKIIIYANWNIVDEKLSKEINAKIWSFIWWTVYSLKVSEDWKIWAYIWENVSLNSEFEYKYNILDSIKYWTLETYNQTLLTFKWLWILVRKIFNPETPKERTEALKQVSWPIWIVDFISHSMKWWIIFLIVIWAIISINLWVFNLLPIPALDWWRFLFITVNGLIKNIFWRKAINEKTEWIIHVWFFVLLIALSLLIAYNDISKIIIR